MEAIMKKKKKLIIVFVIITQLLLNIHFIINKKSIKETKAPTAMTTTFRTVRKSSMVRGYLKQ